MFRSIAFVRLEDYGPSFVVSRHMELYKRRHESTRGYTPYSMTHICSIPTPSWPRPTYMDAGLLARRCARGRLEAVPEGHRRRQPGLAIDMSAIRCAAPEGYVHSSLHKAWQFAPRKPRCSAAHVPLDHDAVASDIGQYGQLHLLLERQTSIGVGGVTRAHCAFWRRRGSAPS
jgi:hypothetical protein